MPALFSQSDIRVEGTLSSDLKYALENGLIYILAKTYGVRPIKVHAERIETFEFGGKAVGAGCSMGVDSLATIKQHYIDDNRYGHKITHLAIFNTCEFGFEDANEANKLFRYEYSRAAAFARETGLELLYVQSNVTSLLNRYGTGLYDTCTLVHAAAILFLENSTPYITTRAGICSTSSNIRHKVWNISISSCSTCVPPEIRKYSPPSQHKSEPNARNTSSTTLSQKIPARLYQDHRRRSRSQLRTLLQMPKDIGSDRHTREAPRIRNDLRSILLQNAQSRHLCEISRIPGGRSLFADILNFAKQKGFRIPKMAYLLSVKYYLLLPAYMLGRELPNPTKKKIKKFLRMKG